jgi:hypothetical protein
MLVDHVAFRIEPDIAQKAVVDVRNGRQERGDCADLRHDWPFPKALSISMAACMSGRGITTPSPSCGTVGD